jgi:hypothetical protein
MDKAVVTLQVFFEEPFWIGICERVEDNQLAVCKITFGSEPKDYELFEYVLRNWYGLRFSPKTDVLIHHKDWINPKRRQREVRKQIETIGIGTKSQQALKAQQEENKLERKERSKQMKEAHEERLFALKQQKRKEKHKGR